jgi:diguanylate cyclase (GGDEF)-like protein/PAS domain S-box-containing protein
VRGAHFPRRLRARLGHSRLALRSAVLILAVVSLGGLVFLFLARGYIGEVERTRQLTHLQELLNTVSNTVSIATFLEDQVLATEVARGLLENRTVNAASLWAGDQQLAAERKPAAVTAAGPSVQPIERDVTSPFVPTQVIGRIVLEPNPAQIQLAVGRATNVITSLMIGLLGLIGLGAMGVAVWQITRPIGQISARLHRLRAEAGEKLSVPAGHERDEIGRLVTDVNALIDRLVHILHKEQQLYREREMEERRFRIIFETAEAGIFQVDRQGVLISFNPAFRRLFGLADTGGEERALASLSDASGLSSQAIQNLISECMNSRNSLSLDLKLPRQDEGPERWVSLSLSAVGENLLQGVANDITARMDKERAVAELAITDPLTGLYNRLGFNRRVEAQMEAARQNPEARFSLLMIDLDKFKPINDTLGHEAGDQVLGAVARLLRQCVRETDFIARLGGDEFVVILVGTVEQGVIRKIAGKIVDAIANRIPARYTAGLPTGASVGIALFDPQAGSARELTARADQAMYRAKQAGRNGYHFFEAMELRAAN